MRPLWAFVRIAADCWRKPGDTLSFATKFFKIFPYWYQANVTNPSSTALFTYPREHPKRTSRNMPVYSSVERGFVMVLYSLNHAGQRRKSDLSWQRGTSRAVFYVKQKGLEGRKEGRSCIWTREGVAFDQAEGFSDVNIVYPVRKFKSSPDFRSSITMRW